MIEFPTTGAEQTYKAYLAEGLFMIQRSKSTGKFTFYPRLLIPGSGETDLEWIEASGIGTVYSITISRRRDGDHNIALVDLEEGVRMMSTIAGIPTVPIGTRVKARIDNLNGEDAVVFEPATEVSNEAYAKG